MFKFLKNLTQDKNECSHKYKEIGKYYVIDTDYDSSKRIVAVAVSECAICGKRKSYAVYEETFNIGYDIACTVKTLTDNGFCSKLEFKLNDYERRKDEEGVIKWKNS